jgi:hypothetical protein
MGVRRGAKDGGPWVLAWCNEFGILNQIVPAKASVEVDINLKTAIPHTVMGRKRVTDPYMTLARPTGR